MILFNVCYRIIKTQKLLNMIKQSHLKYFYVIVLIIIVLVTFRALFWNRELEFEEHYIKRRLEEADAIWARAVAARESLAIRRVLNPKDPWNYQSGISIWDFFYPSYDCPHTVERIGRSGDGGKWVCGVNHLAKKEEPLIVYSFGVRDDTSFEEEIVSRTDCLAYLFDHTINTNNIDLPKSYPGRVFIEKMGMGANNTDNLRTLSSTMKKYGHDFVDILKMDVEGAEFAIFEGFKKEFPDGLPFGQVIVEIHLPETDKDFVRKNRDWFASMESLGLRAFRNEFNFYNLVWYSKTHHPTLCEFSFINVDYDNYLLHAY